MTSFARKSLICAAVGVLIGACGHKKIQVDQDSAQVGKSGVLIVTAGWIKEKSKKFDIQITLQNPSPTAEIVWLKDVVCSRGGLLGNTTMVDARHGDAPIWVRPETRVTVIFTCDLGVPNVHGDFKINISKVFDNPANDGRTVGKVIAKNLAIEQAAK